MEVHYLWIGPPTKINPTSISGHDVAGPIKMAKQLQKQKKNGDTATPDVKFWCLKEHEAFYRQQFQENEAEITVCAIEDLLDAELNGEHAKEAEFIRNYMQEHLEKEAIDCKDLFSLFLLFTQGGYYFDTNVFPMNNKEVHIKPQDEAATGRSPDGFNDFYLMFSPEPYNRRVKQVLHNWINKPGFANISVFKNKDLSIIYNDTIREMGLEKLSYKSYFLASMQRPSGLFFWLGKASLAEYLQYGNLNQTIDNNPISAILIEKCSLCTVLRPITQDDLFALDFNTNEAYVRVVSANREELFYIKKQRKVCELIPHRKEYKSLFSRTEGSKLATKQDIARLHNDYNFGIKNFACDTSSFKEYRHRIIQNICNQTLLHQAVMEEDIESIRLLVDRGANINLKATYRIHPEGTTLELTAVELANYLKLEEISNLFTLKVIYPSIKLSEKPNNLYKIKKEMDQLIREYEDKIKANTIHNSPDAEKKANELLMALYQARIIFNYMQPTYSNTHMNPANDNFKKACIQAINDAMPILEKNFKWGDYLSNLLKKLVNIVPHQLAVNKNRLFQPKPSEDTTATEELEKKLHATRKST